MSSHPRTFPVIHRCELMQKSQRALVVAFLFVLTACMRQTAGAQASSIDRGHIKSVSAITEVFGEGQRVTAAAIEYDKPILSAKLFPGAFAVKGRTITRVYANTSAAKSAQGHDAMFVIVELSPNDPGASLTPPFQGPRGDMGGTRPPGADGAAGTNRPDGPGGGPAGMGGPAGGGPPRGGMMGPAPLPAKVSVEQVATIVTAGGERYAAMTTEAVSDRTVNLVVDDFVQHVFKDPQNGQTLRYNLFVPRNYDASRRYPMVLFMPDASITGAPTERTLTQGVGAVIWATPEEQAKHAAFVLAPTYDQPEATDNFGTNASLETTVNLVQAIASQYSIEQSRLYTTGQSGGCMLSVAIMIKHPDLFAAAMLVAGQWDPKAMTALVNKEMWITVSEGDTRAFPGMNASLAAMEQAGAKVARGKWSARLGPKDTEVKDEKMLQQGTNILYTVYDKGTTFPPGQETSGNEHMQTWKIAYYNESIRDWLFAQHGKSS